MQFTQMLSSALALSALGGAAISALPFNGEPGISCVMSCAGTTTSVCPEKDKASKTNVFIHRNRDTGGTASWTSDGAGETCPEEGAKGVRFGVGTNLQLKDGRFSIAPNLLWVQDDDDGDFEKPLNWSFGDGESSHAIMLMESQPDGKRKVIRIENGEVSVEIDGEEVEVGRMEHLDDGTVKVYDEKGGNVIAEFKMGGRDGNLRFGVGKDANEMFGRLMELHGDEMLKFQPDGGQPRVMLGITMTGPDEATIKRFNLRDDDVIVVERIIEGLPADRAGLRADDIIIEFDGHERLNPEKLRELLRKRNPGEKVEVRVLRDGKKKDTVIKLEAFDGSALGIVGGQNQLRFNVQPNLERFGGDGANEFRFDFKPHAEGFGHGHDGDWEHWHEEAMKGLHEALRGIEGLDEKHGRHVEEQARKAIEQALKALQQQNFNHGQGFSFFDPDDNVVFGDENHFFRVPKREGAGEFQNRPDVGDIERRLGELDDRLERLNDRFDRLERMIERLDSDR